MSDASAVVMPAERLDLLNAALANTSEGVLITDAHLEPPGPRIVYANAAFCRITGYTEEEVLGKNPRILQGPGTDRAELDRLRREIERCNHFHGQTVNYRKNGRPFIMDWRVSPLKDATGRTTHFVAIQRDATEEHNALQSKLQAERLEAIGRVTGQIAHDFANLLVAILGFTELLLEQLEPSEPAFIIAVQIEKTAKRAQVLTRELLTFSRTRHEQRRNVNLRQILAEMESLLNRLVGARISTKVRLPAEDCLVRATTTELEQILINLVTNARDAMPDGGEIGIQTAPKLLESVETKPHGAVPGHYIELTVSDTGIGMDGLTQSRIFEPFFTTKEEEHGTGLGLTSVLRQVRNLNGMITVDSQPQQGSRFRVYLPAGSAEE